MEVPDVEALAGPTEGAPAFRTRPHTHTRTLSSGDRKSRARFAHERDRLRRRTPHGTPQCGRDATSECGRSHARRAHEISSHTRRGHGPCVSCAHRRAAAPARVLRARRRRFDGLSVPDTLSTCRSRFTSNSVPCSTMIEPLQQQHGKPQPLGLVSNDGSWWQTPGWGDGRG